MEKMYSPVDPRIYYIKEVAIEWAFISLACKHDVSACFRMAAATSAVNILAQGKRNMICGEIPTAVNQFQEACRIL